MKKNSSSLSDSPPPSFSCPVGTCTQYSRNHPNHLAPWQNSITKKDIFFLQLSGSFRLSYGSLPLPYDISQQKCLLTSSSQKMHQTKSIVTRLQQTKSVAVIRNVCRVTTNKTNCFKLLKLKHPACQRTHATWQDPFAPKNGYNRTSYVFIFLLANLDICIPSRQGETL